MMGMEDTRTTTTPVVRTPLILDSATATVIGTSIRKFLLQSDSLLLLMLFLLLLFM